MKIKALLLMAAAAALLTTTGAVARDRDRDGRPDHSWGERHDNDGYRDRDRRGGHDGNGYRDGRGGHDGNGYRDGRGGHDRYWQNGYRGYAHRDVFFRNLRHNHYDRWAGDPYWFNGRYVIRTYDRRGRVVIVELNPYTGDVMGVIRF